MKLSGSRQLPGTREAVWQKLNDPLVLQRCIPGCETLEQISPTELKATVKLKIGPISARFTGDVNLVDLNPPESYRIEGSGSGGVAGRASGGAAVRLAEANGGTELTYDVDATVSGKIAQLGQRLIDATAAQLADSFFNKFAAEFDAPGSSDDTSAPTAPSASTSAAASAAAAAAATATPAGSATPPPASTSGATTAPSVTPPVRVPANQAAQSSNWPWYAAGAIALAIVAALIVQSIGG